MALKAYFDGSGTDHDPKTPLLALAGYVGTEEAWIDFEPRWADFLRAEGLEYFHSSEANARAGAFKGWPPSRIALLRAGVTGLIRDLDPRLFHGIVCTVSMPEYRKIDPPLNLSAPMICAKGCLKMACQTVVGEDNPLQIFYDSGESFFPRLHNRWNSKKLRKTDKYLASVSAFTSVDWRRFPAIQAADYLGWCVTNRRAGTPLRLAMLTANLPLERWHFGAKALAHLVRNPSELDD